MASKQARYTWLFVLILLALFGAPAAASAGLPAVSWTARAYLPLVLAKVDAGPIVQPTPKPTPLPTAKPALVKVLPNYTARVGTSGWLNVYGEVLNDTPGRVEALRVSARLYSGSTLLGTAGADVALSPLAPGEKAGFQLDFTSPSGWNKIEFDPVTYTPTTASRPNLAVLNVRTETGSDPYGLIVLGEIRNNDAAIACHVSAHLTVYDDSGRVYLVDAVNYSLSDLIPGETWAFEIKTFEKIVTSKPPAVQAGGDTQCELSPAK